MSSSSVGLKQLTRVEDDKSQLWLNFNGALSGNNDNLEIKIRRHRSIEFIKSKARRA